MKVPSSSLAGLRRTVAELCKEVHRAGLTIGGSGNVSVRSGRYVAVSPSGFRLSDVRPRHVPIVDVEGREVLGTTKPTSELLMHLSLYREVGDGVVIHTHSPYLTALVHSGNRPPETEDLRRSVGEIVWVEYQPPGSERLAEAVAKVARKPMVAALERHGGLVVADRPEAALRLAEALEEAARLAVLRPHP
ncbi:class II aldolase/adducin family protein [Methanopyrus kandleri]|uniref:Predicted epimerase related to ribulose-5-phosphate 4-epimerase n=2 Tax=Methanopyrus kandleri TaxID=2320 RepID=Q8TV16_METKA|nr:class II aldolase/adducin family protein [Methanopyrus kandleri]AAM02798.1 Predicted epimerase related to ribulose-5-phosphate 4-epimerase [Methanopyrus kandleri AV19]HII71059.1 class II aldolase/adducin family protein [Methanopyrus kandleri]